MFSLCCLTSSCITRGTLCFCSFIPSTITSISIPTKSMGYMTYLRLTCAAICWVMISVIITFSIFSTSSLTFCLITSLHWATVSTPAYCWWQPRSSTAPSPTAAWPPGIISDQSQVRSDLPHRLFQDHYETPSRFTWEDLRGKKSSGSCEGNESRRPRRGWIWLALSPAGPSRKSRSVEVLSSGSTFSVFWIRGQRILITDLFQQRFLKRLEIFHRQFYLWCPVWKLARFEKSRPTPNSILVHQNCQFQSRMPDVCQQFY